MLQVPLKLSHFNEVFVQPVAHGRTLVEERVPGGILAAMPEMAQMRCEFKVSQGHLGWLVTEHPPYCSSVSSQNLTGKLLCTIPRPSFGS